MKWLKDKIVWIGLAIVAVVIFFKDAIFAMLIGSARKISNKARKKDEQLKSEADAHNAEANKLKSEADKLGEDIDDRTTDDVSEDWHKRS